jgi:hypothetical protein
MTYSDSSRRSLGEGYSSKKFSNIHESRELILRKNRRTVHIFRDSRAKLCMCGKTSRRDYSRNHVSVEACADDVLQADCPSDLGILGRKISANGLTQLEKKVGGME